MLITQPFDMTHPLITQLRFTPQEFQRALEGVTAEEARRRLLPINSISWNVGHLAWQEQRYFLIFAQGKVLLPRLVEELANGAPASTPPLEEMWEAWRTVTRAADEWLDAVTIETLLGPVTFPSGELTNYGSLVQRVIYHE